MEIDIDDTGAGLVIRYKGRLLTELDHTGAAMPAEYERDVVRGRVAANLVHILAGAMGQADRIDRIGDHNFKTDRDRQAAYLRGLRDGFARRTVDHSFPGVPSLTPEHSPTYGYGYENGEAIRRCLDTIQRADLSVSPARQAGDEAA